MAKPFKGKTLDGKRETRSGENAEEQGEAFIKLYDQFHSILMELDEDDRNDFVKRANDLIDDKEVG